MQKNTNPRSTSRAKSIGAIGSEVEQDALRDARAALDALKTEGLALQVDNTEFDGEADITRGGRLIRDRSDDGCA
jgi:hypothetical protein